VPDAFVRGQKADYGHSRRCARAAVRPECLEAVLADESLVGLWGGTNERERREMRRGAVA
jgi:WhiB family transcriptional regulator, redox-sensing transcriptional regulator